MRKKLLKKSMRNARVKTIDEFFGEIAANIPEEELCYYELCFLITREISNQMNRKGISQTQLAKKIKKTPAFVSRALSGDQNLTLKTIACFITALDSRMEVKIFSQELATGECLHSEDKKKTIKRSRILLKI